MQKEVIQTYTGGWVIFGLQSGSALQAGHIGNIDASPILPSGSTGGNFAGRDFDNDFPIPKA